MSNLVIVESPAKAKTIKKYLGTGYEVTASMGHLRDLPASSLGVDVEHEFKPEYVIIKGRDKLVTELKKKAASSEIVYLASDPDREGEAISWHLRQLLKLDDKSSRRVTFNEITKKAVLNGMEHPRDIDGNLVDAYQARRVLDRIVGYKLSPLLWKKIRKGLSAGRVQSVATRMVVDREEEIRAFTAEEYWNITAMLSDSDGAQPFAAKFTGDEKGKIELHTKEETDEVLSKLDKAQYLVQSVKKSKRQRQPSPPFITSSLQQDASRRLGFTAKKTMMVAQTLYEGVELGEAGMTGLITYMRTDSLRLSTDIVAVARDYIGGRFGTNYVPQSPRLFKTKSNAQDAHEAIRPTYIEQEPDKIKQHLTPDQYKLYKLIWERFIACQMAPALMDTVSVKIGAAGYIFSASGSTVVFPGFTALYEESREAADDSDDENKQLPELKEGQTLQCLKLDSEQKFTLPPPRYTEASLIKAMEENGIGRPSTYATTIVTILDREYVEKENKSLKPTPLGEVVTTLMKDKFKDIIDVDFTAKMEENLDLVEEGKKDWIKTLDEFYASFSGELTKAEEELKSVHIKVPDVESDQVCELCGKKMVIKSGRFGKFLACPGYPECKNTKPITEEAPGACPLCGGKILQKKSKNGNKYFGCEHNPTCGFMTWDVPQKKPCPKCGKTLFKKYTRAEKKIYCAAEGCGYETPITSKRKKDDEQEQEEND